MSAASEATNRLLASIPDITPDVLRESRRQWQKENIIRRCIVMEAERLTKSAHGELESCTPEDLLEIQGRIRGVKQLLTAIESLGNL